MDIWSRNKMSS